MSCHADPPLNCPAATRPWLRQQGITRQHQAHNTKWLRYYWDFCQKNGFEPNDRQSFPPDGGSPTSGQGHGLRELWEGRRRGLGYRSSTYLPADINVP